MKQNTSHGKKMIAPIVITVFLVLYYIGFFILCSYLAVSIYLALFLGLVPLGFAGISIFVLVERIKEIRSGEEDDLSQY